ncbi:KR domain-containing protein [Streptomyces hesseae]|uniref:KR domain-containing protein n=1 Tax=Streptomyces hesseae TaxID=3075519 RepID=A0ABU2T028_9ACTN|nr:KR domain-containing protein [Streptomyces sp. DSM 40473]MDT0453620.1 KR domain-containing protein [Streptomyces sp. DSM 40473]
MDSSGAPTTGDARAVRAFRPVPVHVGGGVHAGGGGPAPAAAFRWDVTGDPRDPLAVALRHASRRDAEPAVAVVLGTAHRSGDSALLLEGIARARLGAGGGRRLVLLHRGAGGGSLLRSAALESAGVESPGVESPGLRVAALELPVRDAGPGFLTHVARLVRDAAPGAELQVAGDGTVTRTGWRAASLPELPVPPDGPALPGGAALVTGGLGGLGLRAAAVLSAVRGYRPVLLDTTAPGELPRRPAALLRRLCDAPPGADVLTVDVTDHRAVARALGRVPLPVRAVVHCAGVVDGGPVALTRARDLDALAAPKAEGLGTVLDALGPGALRHLVVFGSVTARVAHRQLGGYGLANELLRREALRRAAALPRCATVVAEWSLWSGAGQAHEMGAVAQARRMGMAPVPLAPGMAALLRLLRWPAGARAAGAVVLTGPGDDRTFPPEGSNEWCNSPT